MARHKRNNVNEAQPVRAINGEGAINWCRWVLTRDLTRLIILTGGHTACGFIDANVDIALVIVRRYAVVSVRSRKKRIDLLAKVSRRYTALSYTPSCWVHSPSGLAQRYSLDRLTISHFWRIIVQVFWQTCVAGANRHCTVRFTHSIMDKITCGVSIRRINV